MFNVALKLISEKGTQPIHAREFTEWVAHLKRVSAPTGNGAWPVGQLASTVDSDQSKPGSPFFISQDPSCSVTAIQFSSVWLDVDCYTDSASAEEGVKCRVA